MSVCRACPSGRIGIVEEVATTRRRASFALEPCKGRPVRRRPGDPDASVLVVGLAPAARTVPTGPVGCSPVTALAIGSTLRYSAPVSPISRPPGRPAMVCSSTICGSPRRCVARRLPVGRPLREAHLFAVARPGTASSSQPQLRSLLALRAHRLGLDLARARLGWRVPRPKPRFGHGAEAERHALTDAPVRLVSCYHVPASRTPSPASSSRCWTRYSDASAPRPPTPDREVAQLRAAVVGKFRRAWRSIRSAPPSSALLTGQRSFSSAIRWKSSSEISGTWALTVNLVR